MRDATLEIHGMHCDGCAARVNTLLDREPGAEAAAPFAVGCARSHHNEQVVGVELLIELVKIASVEVKGRS